MNFGLCAAVRSCAVLLGLLLGTSGTVLAQADDPLLEGRLLRSSASQESQGNLAEAESILRDLMAQRPTSSEGLFALERVLRSRGRIGDVLPMAIAYRDAEPAAAAPSACC